MDGGFTQYGLTKMIQWFFGISTSNGNPLYAGLSKTKPTFAGGNVTEPSNSSYARVAINTKTYSGGGTSVFGSASTTTDGVKTENSVAFQFPEAFDNVQKQVQDWGECPYICLFSASTGEQLLAFDTLDNALHPGDNNTSGIVVIRAADFKFEIINAPEESEE